jgi:hypothetical protein
LGPFFITGGGNSLRRTQLASRDVFSVRLQEVGGVIGSIPLGTRE